MAKIAYVGLPAHGHTNPTLPVMKELVSRGYQVLFYNSASFRDKVSPTGVEFRPLPEPMPTEKQVSDSLQDFINAPLLLSSISRPLAHYLITEFQKEKPDLVIYDSTAMWGYIAARTNKIPNLCFITTFVLDGSVGAIGIGTIARYILSSLPHALKLLQWRRSMAKEFGKDISGGITEYADSNIVFTSQEFHPPNNFVDERFHFVGPSINPGLRDGSFPFAKLGQGPKVYISLGTIINQDMDFYQATFNAFANYPAQFILSAGRNTAVDQLGPIPDNFIVENYVPQLDILQRVDVFITQGGMNSVHEGLYYNVPEIVIPRQFEQMLNGKRIVQTGCGLLLGTKRPYGRVSSAELKQALNEILSNKNYQKNAQHYGQTLRDAGGYLKAVEIIERKV